MDHQIPLQVATVAEHKERLCIPKAEKVGISPQTIETIEFCKKVQDHVWQNPSSRKYKKIITRVESFIECVLEDLKRKNILWDFNLIKCGSTYDESRVGLPYEFDYMLEWKKIQVIEVQPGKFSQMDNLKKIEVKLATNLIIVNKVMERSFKDVSYEEYSNLKQRLVCDFRSTIQEKKSKFGFKTIEIIEKCNAPNMFVLFMKYQEQGIMVDIVPCFKLPMNSFMLLPNLKQDAVKFIKFLLSKKLSGITDEGTQQVIFQNLRLVSTFVARYWRISTSCIENIIFSHLETNLKCPLRVLKYMCNMNILTRETLKFKSSETLQLCGYTQFLPSYLIKLIYIQVIMSLNDNNEASLLSPENEIQIENILHSMLLKLKSLEYSANSNFSFLFGTEHNLNFRNLKSGCSTMEYQRMIDRVTQIFLHTDMNAKVTSFPLLNYPLLQGVIPLELELQ